MIARKKTNGLHATFFKVRQFAWYSYRGQNSVGNFNEWFSFINNKISEFGNRFVDIIFVPNSDFEQVVIEYYELKNTSGVDGVCQCLKKN